MAQITNQYKELAENHSTEEMILYALGCLEDSINLTRIDLTTDSETPRERLILAQLKSANAYQALRALAEKLNILDDTPTIVA